ncbi:MAG: folylpolyglutamate synthase/dihydrofolate synthase family protein [Alphaproteobacteria bacterium]
MLARLQELHPRVIDLSLGRIERLMTRLGNPERESPPVIHVAGTNGKGSTLATLRAYFEASGLRAHVYTSPHLVRFNERVVVAGQEIGDAGLIALLEECERANADAPITFFEITTAAAFLAFARAPADVTLLETGLGGRLDATNLIARPAVCAITPISLDHQHFLGDTLAAIAGEKAGIIKHATPVVVAPQPPKADAVIRARAAELEAPLVACGRDWFVEPEGDGFHYRSARMNLSLPRPVLPGAHQFVNAGTAIACLEQVAAWRPREALLRAALAKVRWPARLQRLTHGPLALKLPRDWELWLDGGHNPGAGQVIADWLKTQRGMPTAIVVGMLNTKEPVGYFSALAPFVRACRTVRIPESVNTIAAEDLAQVANKAGVPAAPSGSVAAALEEIVSAATAPMRVLICGSLYLAGSVLERNG